MRLFWDISAFQRALRPSFASVGMHDMIAMAVLAYYN